MNVLFCERQDTNAQISTYVRAFVQKSDNFREMTKKILLERSDIRRQPLFGNRNTPSPHDRTERALCLKAPTRHAEKGRRTGKYCDCPDAVQPSGAALGCGPAVPLRKRRRTR